MKTFLKALATLAAIAGIVILLGYAVLLGFKGLFALIDLALVRNEQGECEQWADESKVISKWDPETKTGYYITDWQQKQCEEVERPITNVHVITEEDVK